MSDNNKNNKIDSVLFVCMGNICRSPTAEAVFRAKAKAYGIELDIDSAGTIGSHKGEAPDVRARRAAEARGYDFSGMRARKVTIEDFDRFALILAMDNDNYHYLFDMAPSEHKHKVHLFLQFAEQSDDMEVPDPYYGGIRGFELVLDLVEQASEGLLSRL
ncbi:low molecular weight protein-tyrosine-phosphatase [Thalassotalea ponticola]|uniref:low molecular weight protein-tyrosine-phosphatase n=1 Tax=Thalassotalea ponticola TaxID=1523392 RepID=UPI0025B52294|nr:low molecular weight protein-tyrosine-phosphatase [Thalassotalea ponticola]MDN3651425.1 low molecular weight protein-tyrosine-phosphatase [Thalassotalea ponticola]